MCFDMLGISCRLLLVRGSFQYLHMKTEIPTERLPQNLSRTSFLYADISSSFSVWEEQFQYDRPQTREK